MKASELIRELERVLSSAGDVEVGVATRYNDKALHRVFYDGERALIEAGGVFKGREDERG